MKKTDKQSPNWVGVRFKSTTNYKISLRTEAVRSTPWILALPMFALSRKEMRYNNVSHGINLKSSLRTNLFSKTICLAEDISSHCMATSNSAIPKRGPTILGSIMPFSASTIGLTPGCFGSGNSIMMPGNIVMGPGSLSVGYLWADYDGSFPGARLTPGYCFTKCQVMISS